MLRAPASCCKAPDPAIDTTQAVAQTMLRSPRRPDGILDKMGPRTLDGGYSSPSHVMSSTMLREVEAEVVKGEDPTLGAKAGTLVAGMVVVGAKADTAANAAARRRMLILDMISGWCSGKNEKLDIAVFHIP